jgi:hypothetical protein
MSLVKKLLSSIVDSVDTSVTEYIDAKIQDSLHARDVEFSAIGDKLGERYGFKKGILYDGNAFASNPYTGIYQNLYYVNGKTATGVASDNKYYDKGINNTSYSGSVTRLSDSATVWVTNGILDTSVSGLQSDNKYYDKGINNTNYSGPATNKAGQIVWVTNGVFNNKVNGLQSDKNYYLEGIMLTDDNKYSYNKLPFQTDVHTKKIITNYWSTDKSIVEVWYFTAIAFMTPVLPGKYPYDFDLSIIYYGIDTSKYPDPSVYSIQLIAVNRQLLDNGTIIEFDTTYYAHCTPYALEHIKINENKLSTTLRLNFIAPNDKGTNATLQGVITYY